MTENLRELLELAVGDVPGTGDVRADLKRAQAARRARSLRRLRVGTAGLAIAAVAAVGVTQAVTGAERSDTSTAAEVATDVQLVSEQFDATPYTFDLTPAGWHVQSQNSFRVTIAPDDGSTTEEPDDFRGKLVILFDENPPSGKRLVEQGREFWIGGDSGYVTIAVRTRGDEPGGMVRVQYPADSGWTLSTMLRFLGTVHVGEGAQPGLG